MSTTVHVTVKTKADSFDAMHNYAKEDLAFTREFEGCHSIHASSGIAKRPIWLTSKNEVNAAVTNLPHG